MLRGMGWGRELNGEEKVRMRQGLNGRQQRAVKTHEGVLCSTCTSRGRSPGAQNQQGDHMREPRAAPVAAPASMPMAKGAPEL